jgi:hypothetical protein
VPGLIDWAEFSAGKRALQKLQAGLNRTRFAGVRQSLDFARLILREVVA